jgi:hypothetical protein
VLVIITRMAMGGAGTGGTGESCGEIADWHQRPQAEKHAIQPQPRDPVRARRNRPAGGRAAASYPNHDA